MKKNGRKKDHQHKGKPRSLEGNKETRHRSRYGGFRVGGNRAQKGVAEEMTENEKKSDKVINETVILEGKLRESIREDRKALEKLSK